MKRFFNIMLMPPVDYNIRAGRPRKVISRISYN